MAVAEREQEVEFPEALLFLLEPHRYKVAYGGRGAAKSWGYARALIARSVQEKTLILCAREIQKSIQDSVHRLLSEQIQLMGMASLFDIQQTKIVNRMNGSEFAFIGLRTNVSNVKSYEGFDIVWVEEAQTVSKASWDVLIPTIRKPGSEIWISFNPDLEDDETYQRFVIDPPATAHVAKINYDDNPWFPEVLDIERKDLQRRDPVAYRNVWLGEPKQAIEGAVFAQELTKAAEEQRITTVPIAPGIPVNTAWDLGRSDNTAIWFYQLVGMEYRLLEYYQANGQGFPFFLERLAERDYRYGEHILPHDTDNELLAASKTIRQQLQQAIQDNPALGSAVKVVPRTPSKGLAIDAARGIFNRCWFDKTKTPDGLQCLRRYHYAQNEQTGKVSKEPVHDQWSHGADAFLTLAQYAKKPASKPQAKRVKLRPRGTTWMSA